VTIHACCDELAQFRIVNSHLNIVAFVIDLQDFHFRLLNHYLELPNSLRSEFDDIVGIVIHCIEICCMEVT